MISRNYVHAALAALWLIFSAAWAGGAAAPDLDRLFQRSSLQIATPDARLHKFSIWIADNEARRSRGLMYVEHMDADAGMLFIYPEPQPISMWMKNTHIPLDMVFVSADGRVTKVVANTTPMSTKTIESDKPVTAVIELNGGTAERLRIMAGAQVIHPAFVKR